MEGTYCGEMGAPKPPPIGTLTHTLDADLYGRLESFGGFIKYRTQPAFVDEEAANAMGSQSEAFGKRRCAVDRELIEIRVGLTVAESERSLAKLRDGFEFGGSSSP